MPSCAARWAAATERTPLRHSRTTLPPSGTAARSWLSKSGFMAMDGHCFQATATAPGTRPTHSRSASRSEEHTSELQSQSNLVCRLLLEKKKKNKQKRLNVNDVILTIYQIY